MGLEILARYTSIIFVWCQMMFAITQYFRPVIVRNFVFFSFHFWSVNVYFPRRHIFFIPPLLQHLECSPYSSRFAPQKLSQSLFVWLMKICFSCLDYINILELCRRNGHGTKWSGKSVNCKRVPQNKQNLTAKMDELYTDQ